jgi:hypothetical protein
MKPWRGYSEVFEDATGCFIAEIATLEGEYPYPALVTIDVESGTLLAFDARALGRMLIAAADSADAWNNHNAT